MNATVPAAAPVGRPTRKAPASAHAGAVAYDTGNFVEYLYERHIAQFVTPSAEPSGSWQADFHAEVSAEDFVAALCEYIPHVLTVWGDQHILVTDARFGAWISVHNTAKRNSRKFSVGTFGVVGAINAFRAAVEAYFQRVQHAAPRMLTWAYKTDDGVRFTDVLMRGAHTLEPALYPFLPDPVGMLDRFQASAASILILSGEPGTGKTSLVRYAIERFGWKTLTTYDADVMRNDRLYLHFLDHEPPFDLALLEDADRVLKDRISATNDLMSRILNVADGLVDLSGRKLIFTANLKANAQIDEAILRPGRCFGVVHFRRLSASEAVVAAEALGRPVPAGNDASLGDIVSDGIGAALPRFGVAP